MILKLFHKSPYDSVIWHIVLGYSFKWSRWSKNIICNKIRNGIIEHPADKITTFLFIANIKWYVHFSLELDKQPMEIKPNQVFSFKFHSLIFKIGTYILIATLICQCWFIVCALNIKKSNKLLQCTAIYLWFYDLRKTVLCCVWL